MWLFTSYGFFSAVVLSEHDAKAWDFPAGHIALRARVKAHLTNLHTNGFVAQERTIFEVPHRDYPYRIVLPQPEFVTLITELAEHVNYTNFKNSVPDAEHELYMKVWRVMYSAERFLKEFRPIKRFASHFRGEPWLGFESDKDRDFEDKPKPRAKAKPEAKPAKAPPIVDDPKTVKRVRSQAMEDLRLRAQRDFPKQPKPK
jgi:hypothetical protein